MKTQIAKVDTEVSWHHGLSKRQVEFVVAYVENDFNSRAAYCAVRKVDYFSSDFATKRRICAYAQRTFSSKSIRVALKTLLDEMLGGIKDTLSHRIIDTYQTRAFYNIADVLDDSGDLRVPLSELGKLACVIDGVEKKQASLSYEVDEEGNRVPVVNTIVKYTLADRDKALEMLAKYMKLIQTEDGGTKTLGVIYISNKVTEDDWEKKRSRLVSGDIDMAVDAVVEEDDGGQGDDMDSATEATAGA